MTADRIRRAGRHLAGAVLLALALVLVLGPSAVRADHKAGHQAATTVSGAKLSVSAPAPVAGPLSLEARLTDASGMPLPAVTIAFFVEVEFFGPRSIALGSANTDASGVARIQYWPSWSGVHRLTARAAGSDGSNLSSPELTETLTAAAPAIRDPQDLLPVTRTWAPAAAVLGVAAVWGTLGALFIAVVLGVRRAARPAAGSRQRPLGRPHAAPGPSDS